MVLLIMLFILVMHALKKSDSFFLNTVILVTESGKNYTWPFMFYIRDEKTEHMWKIYK